MNGHFSINNNFHPYYSDSILQKYLILKNYLLILADYNKMNSVC